MAEPAERSEVVHWTNTILKHLFGAALVEVAPHATAGVGNVLFDAVERAIARRVAARQLGTMLEMLEARYPAFMAVAEREVVRPLARQAGSGVLARIAGTAAGRGIMSTAGAILGEAGDVLGANILGVPVLGVIVEMLQSSGAESDPHPRTIGREMLRRWQAGENVWAYRDVSAYVQTPADRERVETYLALGLNPLLPGVSPTGRPYRFATLAPAEPAAPGFEWVFPPDVVTHGEPAPPPAPAEPAPAPPPPAAPGGQRVRAPRRLVAPPSPPPPPGGLGGGVMAPATTYSLLSTRRSYRVDPFGRHVETGTLVASPAWRRGEPATGRRWAGPLQEAVGRLQGAPPPHRYGGTAMAPGTMYSLLSTGRSYRVDPFGFHVEAGRPGPVPRAWQGPGATTGRRWYEPLQEAVGALKGDSFRRAYDAGAMAPGTGYSIIGTRRSYQVDPSGRHVMVGSQSRLGQYWTGTATGFDRARYDPLQDAARRLLR